MRLMNAWVPPWVPIKSYVCARYDCNELRVLGRRYCRAHADLWDALQAKSGGGGVTPMGGNDD